MLAPASGSCGIRRATPVCWAIPSPPPRPWKRLRRGETVGAQHFAGFLHGGQRVGGSSQTTLNEVGFALPHAPIMSTVTLRAPIREDSGSAWPIAPMMLTRASS